MHSKPRKLAVVASIYRYLSHAQHFVDRFLVAMGRPETRGRVPYSVAYLAATVAELFDAMRGDVERPESGLTRFAVRYMCTHHYFSIAKARRMLGYQPVVSIEQGIARTVEHLRSSGQIGR